MTRKQAKFVARYLKHGNASKAAREAGYSKQTAGAIGAENLRKPQIREKIEQANAQVIAGVVMEKQEYLEMLTRQARDCHAGLKPYLKACTSDGDLAIDINPENITAAVESIEQHIKPAAVGSGEEDIVVRKVKIRDSLPYLNELAKARGFHTPEQHEVTGPMILVCPWEQKPQNPAKSG